MNIHIESPDEFRAAGEAIERYRQEKAKSQKHVGLHNSRLDCPCESTVREHAFLNAWRKENSKRFGQSRVIDCLLSDGKDLATDREVEIAATIMQWLGTNVGFCFVMTTLADCGYRVSKIVNPEASK